MKRNIITKSSFDTLISRFNNRETNAFGEVYTLFYKELYYFTSKFIANDAIEVNDVLHDIFINILEKSNQQFEDEISIKAFMYRSIKNYFCNKYNKEQTQNKYIKRIINDPDYFIFQVAEIESYSLLSDIVKQLPLESAKVFKMHVEGYSIKEIAEILGKAQSTVYNQKQSAVSFIKNRLLSIPLFMIL